MQDNNKKIAWINSEYIDWLCNSEGNFADVSFRTLNIDNWSDVYKYVESKIGQDYMIYEATYDQLQKIYIKTYNKIEQINFELQKKFSNVNIIKVYMYHSLKVFVDGMYLKDKKALDLLIVNAPKRTLQIINWKGTVESFCDKYDVDYLFALTRIYEREGWHKKMYELYRTLTPTDFEKRSIKIMTIRNEHIHINKVNTDKMPIWEDKIMGTIFLYNMAQDLSPLRILSKFFHYSMELNIHSRIISYFEEMGEFEKKFMNYFLQSENDTNLFFEPHCLIEAYCWEYSVHKLFSVLCENGIIYDENTYYIMLNKEKKIIFSNNFIDAISNYSKGRMFPGKHRMFSMGFKYKLFRYLILKNENFLEYIVDKAI